LTTGGREFGATSTRSSSASRARRSASSTRTTPTCSPAGPTSRTSGTRMRSLVRGSLIAGSFSMILCAGARREEEPGRDRCRVAQHLWRRTPGAADPV